jgi:hypothetical protein
MKRLLVCTLFVGASAATTSFGQLISSFDSLGGPNFGGSWVSDNALSFNAGVLSIGSPALGNGNFEFADIAAGTISLTESSDISFRARVDSGNLANSFIVRFADADGNYALEAVVVTTSWIAGAWNEGILNLDAVGGGNSANLAYFTVSGDSNANAFRMSFDSLGGAAPIPEPSTAVALLGAVSLGFAALRRRRRSA